MINPEKGYFEEAAQTFARFFTIPYKDYDAIKTSNGNYFCRNCATKVKRSQNCPNCKRLIDWSNSVIGVRLFLFILLKDDQSDTDPRPTKEFNDKVKSLPDNELISLTEGLFDNPKKSDLELIKASTWEVDLRFFAANGFFERWFKREQYNKWERLRALIEAKATEFVLEKIQKQK